MQIVQKLSETKVAVLVMTLKIILKIKRQQLQEPGKQVLCHLISELAPQDAYYAHEEAWHDGNGHSHVQAALIGPSISVVVRNGKLALGTWQQIVAKNHDNRQRERKIEVILVGMNKHVGYRKHYSNFSPMCHPPYEEVRLHADS